MVKSVHKLLKRVCLLAVGLVSIPARSQVDEEPLLFDQELEATLFEESAAAEPGSSLWHTFMGNALFTYRREQSYSEFNPSGVETDRTSVRVQWGRPLGSHFFVKYDGKSLLYFFGDLQAENAGRSQLYRHKTREFYLQASWGQTSLAVGKQIVIWGESDIASVTDELSPSNAGDSIFTSQDEARIGQDLLKIDHFSNSGQWSLIVIPYPAVDVESALTNAFNGAGSNSSGLIEEGNNENLGTEFGLRWKNSFWKGDFSVMVADLIDNQPVYARRGDGSGSSEVPEYHRFQMLGVAAKLGLGAASLSLEAAYKKGLSFSSTSQFLPQRSGTGIGYHINRGYGNKDTFEAAMNLEYNLDATQSVFLGYSTRYIAGGVADIDETRSYRNNISLGWSGRYLRELLSLSYNFEYQFEDESSIHTLSNAYSLTDNLLVNMNLFVLKTSSEELATVFDQTSLLFGMEYNF